MAAASQDREHFFVPEEGGVVLDLLGRCSLKDVLQSERVVQENLPVVKLSTRPKRRNWTNCDRWQPPHPVRRRVQLNRGVGHSIK